ncbi:Caveolin-3 [Branchiostoma belcheri]|nr:Caveolin-3 [Branchiostoma belcheri]
MLPLLILAVLGLVGAAPRRPYYPEGILCRNKGGRCMTGRSTCETVIIADCGGNGERICCLGDHHHHLSTREGDGPQELDFINRDPNNINEILGDANLDDALAEPEGTHKK